MIGIYTHTHDRQMVVQGDTLKAIQFKLTTEDGEPIVPLAVCAQIRSKAGTLLHEYTAEIYQDGVVVLPDVIADWQAGVHRYEMRYTLPDGLIRTYFKGSITVVAGMAVC